MPPTSSTSCGTLDGRTLDGLRIVVDSANGSASGLAAELFERAGAEVVAIGCEPDGTNINDGCGSTATELLAGAVVEHGAHLGLALDGDADRLLAVDGTGALVDGDSLLALFARDLADRGQLAGNTVVVTVMTNLGFRRAMEERGILVKETDVGDRHVLAAIDKEGFSLGGEQSGHIIFRRLATTGDGLLTGLVLADLLARSGSSLVELLDGFIEPVPQTLVNVKGVDPRCSAQVGGHRHGHRAGGGGHGCHRAGCWSARAEPSRWSGSWSSAPSPAWPRPPRPGCTPSSSTSCRPPPRPARPGRWPRPTRPAWSWTPASEPARWARAGLDRPVPPRRHSRGRPGRVAWPSMCGIIGITTRSGPDGDDRPSSTS